MTATHPAPIGMHHCALVVKDVRRALHFFTQVCGMEMLAYFWMHGVEGAYHIFFRLGERTTFAIAFDPKNVDVAPAPEQRGQFGVDRTPGNIEHFAMTVGSEDDLLAMNDRLRSNGYMTYGPIDHGKFKSVYVPHAVEGRILLEFAVWTQPLDRENTWIDSECYEHGGFTAADIEAYCNPPAFEGQGGTLPNPEYNPELQPGMAPDKIGMLSNPDVVAQLNEMMAEPKHDKDWGKVA